MFISVNINSFNSLSDDEILENIFSHTGEEIAQYRNSAKAICEALGIEEQDRNSKIALAVIGSLLVAGGGFEALSVVRKRQALEAANKSQVIFEAQYDLNEHIDSLLHAIQFSDNPIETMDSIANIKLDQLPEDTTVASKLRTLQNLNVKSTLHDEVEKRMRELRMAAYTSNDESQIAAFNELRASVVSRFGQVKLRGVEPIEIRQEEEVPKRTIIIGDLTLAESQTYNWDIKFDHMQIILTEGVNSKSLEGIRYIGKKIHDSGDERRIYLGNKVTFDTPYLVLDTKGFVIQFVDPSEQ